jgi:uncharacterized protein YndB with AHSA1/START domain
VADITHEIRIAATPEHVFRALTTAVELSNWYTAGVAGTGATGSEWHFHFTGRPDFRWRIVAAEPARRVAWQCVAGPGDAAGTTVDYEIAATDDGRTLVTCTHAGWPHTEGNFRKCNTIWGGLLHHLKDYVETGVPRPTFV